MTTHDEARRRDGPSDGEAMDTPVSDLMLMTSSPYALAVVWLVVAEISRAVEPRMSGRRSNRN